MIDLVREVEELKARLNQMVRLGEIEAVLADRGAVTVRLPDSDDLVTAPLPVLFARTSGNKEYDMPVKGEQVLCIFLMSGMEQGFVLGSPYSLVDRPPVSTATKKHYEFADGSTMEYDRTSHKLSLDIKGSVTIKATGDIAIESSSHIGLSAPRIDLN